MRDPGPRTTTTITCSSSVSRRKASESAPVSRTWNPPAWRARGPGAEPDEGAGELEVVEVPGLLVPRHREAARVALLALQPDLVAVQERRARRRSRTAARTPPAAGPGRRPRTGPAGVSWLPSRSYWQRATAHGIAARKASSDATISSVRPGPAGDDRAEARAAVLDDAQPLEDRVGEPRVVHDAVPLVAVERVGRVVEVLAHQVRVGVRVLDGGAHPAGDLRPELDRALAAQHVGHVDAPAVGRERRLEPAAQDRALARVHRLAQPGVAVVELGQRLHAQPRLVVVGPRAERVEAGGRRRRVGLRGEEPGVLGAGVVGRDVEDQRGCRARASRGAGTRGPRRRRSARRRARSRSCRSRGSTASRRRG